MDRNELERLAARCLCIGFGGPDDAPPRELLDLGLGGVVLFARNLQGKEAGEVAAMTDDLKLRNNGPLLIAIDQEGGRVRRSRGAGFSPVPSMREVGQHDDPQLARDVGRLIGYELRALGIDVNFAPVVDVDTNPDNPVIADRSFGADPALVGRLGAAVVQGLQEMNVAACAKHFPGHGDTSQDSHHDLPRLTHDLERLRRVELPPFTDAIAAGVASIMTAHVVFEPIDSMLPATMSQAAMDVLRSELGYDGVVVTDDLEMRAVSEHFGVMKAVRSGLAAGVDWFTICHTPESQLAAHDALVSAVVDGEVPEARLRQAAERVSMLAAQFGGGSDVAAIGTSEHERLQARVFSRLSEATDGFDPTDPTQQLA